MGWRRHTAPSVKSPGTKLGATMNNIMKGWLGWVIGLLLVLSGAVAEAKQAPDLLGVPGPVQFEGQQFDLVFSAAPIPDYRKHEYIPAGQVPEQYRDMILLELFAGLDIKTEVLRKIDWLKDMQASDPILKYKVAHDPKTGQVIIHSIMSDNEGPVPFVEWNVSRYIPARTRDGRDASLLMGVSRRAYGEDMAPFLERLSTLGTADVKALSEMPLPKLRGLD